MTLLHEALRAGTGHAPRRPDRPDRDGGAPPGVVVAGAAGALGSAILERLLGHRRIGPVRVLVSRGFTVALHGLEPVQVDAADWGGAGSDGGPAGGGGTAERRGAPDSAGAAAGRGAPDPDGAAVRAGPVRGAASDPAVRADGAGPLGDTALIVFDRPRHVNGRERAFVQPRPAELPALAGWLKDRGARRLVVVLPHAPASLPEALKHGLADLDEHAVAALGFERLVFVRSAEAPRDARARRWLQRLADGVLAQLRIMVAPTHQPVRAPKVAAFVAELLAQLPTAPEATRVAPPELVWHAAQLADPAPLVAAWLARRELPVPPRPARVVR